MVDKIKTYIWEHVSEDISLITLSELVYMNPAYLSRYFRQETGSSITEFLLEVRVEQAKQLLADPHNKVQDIAGRLGIESASYFIRIFKKKMGVTPQEYRRQILAE